MPRAREIARDRARDYRQLKASNAREEQQLQRGQLSRVLCTAREIASDSRFAEIARQQRATLVPKRLLMKGSRLGNDIEGQDVLDFIVAWKFFFPTFRVEMMRSYLEETWPGFIDELKDVFIGLVMRGPFFSGRRPSINLSTKSLLT